MPSQDGWIIINNTKSLYMHVNSTNTTKKKVNMVQFCHKNTASFRLYDVNNKHITEVCPLQFQILDGTTVL